MRLFLVSLALMSLSSIPLPVSAEQQICELERAGRKLSKKMGLNTTAFLTPAFIPDNCEEGDLLYLTAKTSYEAADMEILFLANCKYDTYQKVWNVRLEKGSNSKQDTDLSSSYRCIYRGKGNELKRRNGRPSNPFEKEK